MTSPASSPAFSVRNLNKIFVTDRAIPALNNINLDIEANTFTCIVGPSGSGKSTLLRIMGDLETQTTGEVIRNFPPADVPAASFVFQEHGIFPWATVVNNVAFGLRMAGVPKKQRLAIADDWIEKAGLAEFRDQYPHQLSGGMRQRVAIARAFATGSPALLMDEPFGALDAQTRTIMQDQLLQLWEHERKTVVLVTHSIEEALLLGDRIVLMSARPGRIKDVIDVPFDHPRTREIERDQTFLDLKDRIWESLREEVNASLRNEA